MNDRVLRLEISRSQFLLFLSVLMICASVRETSSETITMSTTYPAPFGVYNQIITTGNGGASPADTTLNKNAGNTILVPPTNAAGKVGVGTTSPGYALDVAGTINGTSVLNAVYNP